MISEIIFEKGMRYPNLSTVLMVEDYLKEHADIPITMAKLRKELPKKVMHQTLKLILQYLWQSGKILYGPKGIQWIYAPPEHITKMLTDTIEV
ncbi:MAG: hypothetical protein ACMXYA_03420 [Candidatus Woesearchaeota archaeon]